MNNKFTKNISLILLASITSTNFAMAKGNFQYTQNNPQPQYQQNYYPQSNQSFNQNTLKGRVVTVPAGAQFPAIVTTPISSEFLILGQPVSLTLGSDFYYNSTYIAPAGSSVCGTVVQVTKAKRGTINGQLNLRFTEIVTPYGARIPISAKIKTDDGTGLLRGGTKADTAKEYAKDIAAGSAVGALGGLVASAISGGAIGKGTAIMTGVGAGVGLGKSLIDKGQDVVIPSNSTIELQIDQPITVNPSGYNYDN